MRLGRYELFHRLAKGGMGEVFLARRKGPGEIEKRVVIKRIRPELSGDPRFVEMFLREARVSMGLSHRNIAAVFDFGRAGRELFLAMEHVHGRDLGRALRAARRVGSSLSEAAAIYVALQICRALEYAHDSASGSDAVIHRDLSPKNILLSFSGEVVVADFGLAVDSHEQLKDGAVQGTPAYLSPEQAQGKPVDARSDLFSLGLVLGELACGQPLYRAETPKELVALAREGRVELPGSVSPALAAVIEKATATAPEQRFESAREMAAALDEVLVAARSAGAKAPERELASWMHELFDADEVSAKPVAGDAVAAVTFLDDGDNAVAREARDLGDATMASIAETVAESGAAVDGAESAAAVDGAESGAEVDGAEASSEAVVDDDEPGRRFGWVMGAAAAAAAVVVLGVWIRSTGDADKRDRSIDGAMETTAVGTVDAGLAVSADARDADLDLDAAPPVPDAAPPVVAKSPEYGFLRVQSRPWAEVKVRGSVGCAETPCRLRLPAGAHTVRLENPVSKASASRKVTIEAGESIDISVTLKAPE